MAKTTVAGIFTFLSSLLFIVSPALSASLDEPASPHKPTVRTDIKRGHDVAFDCFLQYLPVTNLLGYNKCVENASTNQDIQRTNTAAFTLGLTFTSAIDLAGAYDILSKRGMDTTLVVSACGMYIAGVDESEKSLKLSDATVIKALHMNSKGLE